MWYALHCLLIAICCPLRLAALPPTVKHLVVVPTVPVVFPKLPLSEAILQTMDQSQLIKGALQKTGLAAGILDKHVSTFFVPMIS